MLPYELVQRCFRLVQRDELYLSCAKVFISLVWKLSQEFQEFVAVLLVYFGHHHFFSGLVVETFIAFFLESFMFSDLLGTDRLQPIVHVADGFE